MNNSDTQWFYLKKDSESLDNTKGPFTDTEIKELLEYKVLNKNDYLFKEGMTQWLEIYKIDNFSNDNITKETVKKKKIKKNKKINLVNTAIYVYNIPLDNVTYDDILEFFSKAGIIKADINTDKPKIKLYEKEATDNGTPGLIIYEHPESVDIALELLNGKLLGINKIKLERAKFNHNNISHKENNSTIIKQKEISSNITNCKKHEKKIIVLKNLFTLDQVKSDSNFLNNIEFNIVKEFEDNIGNIKYLKLFENNKDGIAVIKFEDGDSADKCININNGRMFNGRKIECFYYDGITKY